MRRGLATEFLWTLQRERPLRVRPTALKRLGHSFLLWLTLSCADETPVIAVEGKERSDIRRNGCNQIGDAALLRAVELTQ
jgi:hypothetical protein